MIKIDVDERIWKAIKKGHSEWYEEKILPNIEKACKFLESKKNKENLIKEYLELLNKIKEKGKNFVIEEIKENFEDRKKEKEFYENLKKDFKEHSEWCKENILPDIEKACKFLESKKNEESLIKEYLDLLNKIKEKKKIFVVKKNSVKNYENLKIKKEYLPQNLLFYEEYLPDKLFNYEKLKNDNKKWSRHKLLSLMKIEVCPYCQRNYISSYEENNDNKPEENNDKKTTATLDHFYPKADYPFLALSLYNFIPSCYVCNTVFKNGKEVQIYPYEEGFDELEVKFKTSKEAIYEILGEKDSNFSVKIDYENLEDEENKKKVENSIGNLGLDRVYKKSHNQYIQDLLYTIEKYPENYLEACGEMFENDNDKKKQLEEYFKDIVKEPYRKRIENGEPLAKLTKDILEEFDIKI